MRSRFLVVILALALASDNAPPPATEIPGDLSAGISLVKEGDFEGAVVKLDAAVRGLETWGDTAALAQAYLFLGVAYLELDQETLARGKFAQALAGAPEMRLDPAEFSRQVIRIFETTRQEALSVRPNDRKIAGAPPPSGEAAEGEPRRRSAVPWVILGGAAVAGGVTLAARGGSPPAGPTPSPSPSASPSPTAPPTTTPPPPPPTCSYGARPRTQDEFDDDGGTGQCIISAGPTCSWNAVSTKPSWLVITLNANGQGDAAVRFTVRPNNSGNERSARIELQQDSNAFCRIDQDDGGGSGPGLLPSLLAWSSDLEVPGGTGRMAVDGAHAALLGSGRSDGARSLRPGSHRLEAVLTSARGQPGVWRFRFAAAFRPGSLRVRVGDAVSVSPDTVVFRLRGTPGERIVFDLEAGR